MQWLVALVWALAVLRAASAQSAAPESGASDSYRAHLASAEYAMRLGEPVEMRRWLDGAPEAHRGWEWRYLHALADESVRSFEACPKGVMSIDVSPDSTQIVTGGSDGSVVVWEAGTGRRMLACEPHGAEVYSVRFHMNGERVVSASRDKKARVSDVRIGGTISEFSGHANGVASAAFSADGMQVASCSWIRKGAGESACVFGEVLLWDAATGKPAEFPLFTGGGVKPLSGIEFSRDGTRLVVSSWDGAAYEWDASRGGEAKEWKLPDEGVYNATDCMDLLPDRGGSLIATGSKDRVVRVLRAGTGELVASLRGHTGYVDAVAFSRDGSMLASAGHDATIRVWDTKSWKEMATLRGHSGAVRGLVWALGTLYSGSFDGTVRAWSLRPRDVGTVRINCGETGSYSAAFSPDGERLYTAFYSGKVVVWDARTGAKLKEWTAHEGKSCNMLSLSGDGAKLLTCSWDKTARLWNSSTGDKLAEFMHEPGGPYHCALSADGQRAITSPGGPDLAVWIWDVEKGEVLHKMKGHEKGQITEVGFSPNGARAYSNSSDGTARLWGVERGELLTTLRSESGNVSSASFSPDGELIVTADSAGVARLWRTSDGALVRVLLRGDDPLQRVAFSPDGKRIAAAGNALYLLDPREESPLLRLSPHADTIYNLSWSPDGSRLATVSWDGTIAVLDSRSVRERPELNLRQTDRP